MKADGSEQHSLIDSPGGSYRNYQADWQPVVAPPPSSLQIKDQTGTTVSDTTQTKIVGQRIDLNVSSTSGGQLSNIQWHLTGNAIKDYIHGDASEKKAAQPIDLSPAELNDAEIPFYWIQGGEQTATVSAEVNGEPRQATVIYNVLAPTMISMQSLTGKVDIYDFSDERQLLFGSIPKNKDRTAGIKWTFRAIAPVGGNGEIDAVQLINWLHINTCNNGKTPTSSSRGAFVLDTLPIDPDPLYGPSVPIAGGPPGQEWNGHDSPGVLLTPDLSKAFAHDNFETFFMYKPQGLDSIWVTIGQLDWNWTGNADRRGAPKNNNWKLTGDGHSTDPVGVADNVLPSWAANSTEFHFDPRKC